MPEGLESRRASVSKHPFRGGCAVTLSHLCAQLLLLPPLWRFLSSISKIISLSPAASATHTLVNLATGFLPFLDGPGSGSCVMAAGEVLWQVLGLQSCPASWCFLPSRRLLSGCHIREQASPQPGSSPSPQSLLRTPLQADAGPSCTCCGFCSLSARIFLNFQFGTFRLCTLPGALQGLSSRFPMKKLHIRPRWSCPLLWSVLK